MTSLLSPLSAVQWIFGHHARLVDINEDTHTLAHIVSDFLDGSPVCCIARVARSGNVRWLQRVVTCRRRRVEPDVLDHWLCTAASSAARLGHSAVVRWILIEFMAERMPLSIAASFAAAIGDIDLLFQLIAVGQHSDEALAGAAKAAARYGHLESLQLVISVMQEPQAHGRALLVPAIEGGYRDCIEWLLSLGWVNDPVVRLSTCAVQRGECETVRWLLARFPMAVDLETVFPQAARGRPELIAFLYEELQYEPSETIFGIALSLACQDGALEVVNLLWHRRNRCFGDATGSLSPSIVDCAIRGGHLNVCEFLWEADQPTCLESAMLRSAVESGRSDVLRWVLDRVPTATVASALTPHVCVAVAKAGHLEMLQYLADYGIAPESTKTFDAAATNGHLNVCKWLLEQRFFDADRDALLGALMRQLESDANCSEDEQQQTRGYHQRKFVAVACWLWERISKRNALEPPIVNRLLCLAARHGVERIVRDLYEEKQLSAITSLSPALDAAVEFGRADVVRYLMRCGATLSTFNLPVPTCLIVCIRYGYMETLSLLYESTGASWSLELLRALETEAASTRHLILQRWLVNILQRRIQ